MPKPFATIIHSSHPACDFRQLYQTVLNSPRGEQHDLPGGSSILDAFLSLQRFNPDPHRLMSPSHLDTIRRHCLPLDPVPTEVEPVLRPLHGIQAVLFDVYGTLFISASGDVGTAAVAATRSRRFGRPCRPSALPLQPRNRGGCQSSGNRLAADHLLAVDSTRPSAGTWPTGIEYPEVDIVAIWGDTLARLRGGRTAGSRCRRNVDLAGLAVEYEVRVNPTWPMPGAVDCLHELERARPAAGDHQQRPVLHPGAVPGLAGSNGSRQLGFEPELQFYSYQWGWAKPGRFLYEQAAEALSRPACPLVTYCI